MNIVGDDLAEAARRTSDSIRFDLFARSAYNRYYYSVFLHVRMVLKTIDNKWAKPAHKDLPSLLRGKVLTRLKKQIQVARSYGQITPTQGKQMYHMAATAAAELSTLLDSAREVRRVADYEPEQVVDREGVVIKLGSCKLDTAKNWKQRGETQAKTILKVYDQLGLI